MEQTKMEKNRATLIAITGGIASGKSAVSGWLENHDYCVIYSDKLGHEILQETEVVKILSEKFGEQILENGQIFRPKLGKVVFGNEDNLLFLNNLIHPLIRQKMQDFADNFSGELLFYEIPLLYENGLADKFDQVINVYCSEETKIARMKQRDGLDEDSAKTRIKSQLPDYIKKERADINLQNNGSLEELLRQLENIGKYLDKLPQKDLTRMI